MNASNNHVIYVVDIITLTPFEFLDVYVGERYFWRVNE